MPRHRVEIWDIQEGERLPRSRVHDRFGGNRQSGIAPSRKSPNVLLFSDPVAGARHGYLDDLTGDPVLYYGEGQRGDQEISHGNKAILQHHVDGRALRLFLVDGREVEYLGEYQVDEDEPFFWTEATQAESDVMRKAVIFRLRRVRKPT